MLITNIKYDSLKIVHKQTVQIQEAAHKVRNSHTQNVQTQSNGS